MKFVDHYTPLVPPIPLTEVQKLWIEEFQLPKLEQQGIAEMKEIQQYEGESAWEYAQRFRDVMSSLFLFMIRITRNGLFKDCFN